MNCLFCNSSRLAEERKITVPADSTLLRCDDCGLRFWYPLPEDPKNFYESAEAFVPYEKPLAWNHKAFLKREHNIASLIDFGCGPGEFLGAVKKRFPNARLFGMDIARRNVEFVTKTYGIPAEAIPIENITGEYQFVTAFEVIEHLKNPLALVKKAKELLVPGGIFVVSYPNFERFGDRDEIWDFPPNHLLKIPLESIKKLLEANGFKISYVEEETIGTEYFKQKFSRGRFMTFLRGLRGKKLVPGLGAVSVGEEKELGGVRRVKDIVLRGIFAPVAFVAGLFGAKHASIYIEAVKE